MEAGRGVQGGSGGVCGVWGGLCRALGGGSMGFGVPRDPPTPPRPPDQAQTKLKGVIYFQAIEEVWYDPGRVAGKVRRGMPGGSFWDPWGCLGSVGLGAVMAPGQGWNLHV